jgi:hypothetical protein
MDNKEKINMEKMFQEGDFPFPFRKFEKMAEMMRSCCTGEGGMGDCCSMMRKMMGQEGRGEKKQETEKPSKERG